MKHNRLSRLARARVPKLSGAVLAAAAFALLPGPAAARSDEPLPRIVEAICPGVAGVQVPFAEAVVGRIRANAEQLGIPMSNEESCVPTIIVAVVESGRDYLERMRASSTSAFSEIDQGDRRELFEETGPVRVLMRVRTQTRDGHLVSDRESLAEVPQAAMWSAHSRIYTPTINEIFSVLVLVDRSAMAGLNSTQLADYVTFRAFSKARPEGLSAGESILTLFDAGSSRPAELTALDRAFLGTLYRDRPNLPGSARLAALEAATGRRATRD
jgi:hypothetical protein